ncbi:MAG: hypothetical protein D3906_08925 [Candidatus Electrothrix sp. AUS1_2]|nr:hypothetical protein [Candidatus Electrothrix sp. AUS1_2]
MQKNRSAVKKSTFLLFGNTPYEKSLKYYRDMKNSLDTAFDEGKEEGRIEEKRQVVINGLQQGLNIQMIAALTGLSEEAIEKIAEKLHEDAP